MGRGAAKKRSGARRLDRDTVYQRFYALVDSIPRGRVATYGQIAREAGLPRHSRHVGHALRALPEGSRLPWHRVLSSTGHLSTRATGGHREQRRRLEAEGVELSKTARVDLARFGWQPDF